MAAGGSACRVGLRENLYAQTQRVRRTMSAVRARPGNA